MNDMRPLILLSNDDGVQAKGLNELIDMLSPLGDILVMAPDSARSVPRVRLRHTTLYVIASWLCVRV